LVYNETRDNLFCKTNKSDLESECMLPNTMLSTIKKYVFFSSDKKVVANYTKQEDYVVENYAEDVQQLMQQVQKPFILPIYIPYPIYILKVVALTIIK
jgi:hypothetical protein